MLSQILKHGGLFLLSFVSISLAQDVQPPVRQTRTAEAAAITKVVPLSHAEAEPVVRSLLALNLPIRITSASGNKLVIAGEPEALANVVELVAQLDAPETRAEDRQAHFIPFGESSPDELMDLLHNVVGGLGTRLALDRFGRSVIVVGSETDVKLVERIVDSVNVPRRPLTLHFYFVRATIRGNPDPQETDLPSNLSPVAATMNENGFGNLGLLSTLIITAEDGREFEHTSKLASGQRTLMDDAAGMFENLEFAVEGVARLDGANSTVQLQLQGMVTGEYRTETSGGETAFRVDTALGARLDNYVVLAAGPGSTAAGDAIALVIRVTAG